MADIRIRFVESKSVVLKVKVSNVRLSQDVMAGVKDVAVKTAMEAVDSIYGSDRPMVWGGLADGGKD